MENTKKIDKAKPCHSTPISISAYSFPACPTGPNLSMNSPRPARAGEETYEELYTENSPAIEKQGQANPSQAELRQERDSTTEACYLGGPEAPRDTGEEGPLSISENCIVISWMVKGVGGEPVSLETMYLVPK